MERTLVGFGLGPIQSGLFLLEAFRSGKFTRLVVAEIDEGVVRAIRQSAGKYLINVAQSHGLTHCEIEGVEVYNPLVAADCKELISAISSADEIATALPSVEFYTRGTPTSAQLLAEGFRKRIEEQNARLTVAYAAENHNHAAECLRNNVLTALPKRLHTVLDEQVQFVNTVIGKMSGVVTDSQNLSSANLRPLTEDANRAIVVEQFNRILIDRIKLEDFERGLESFDEKSDLVPFEEAKLYGHNAAHALLGYLAHRQGFQFMSEVRDRELLEYVTAAFLEESGKALCLRHQSVDPLFTDSGWQEYVQDLVQRMTNPYLRDQVERVVRDPRRKLGWHDRLIGTMRLALQHGIQPVRFARGAAAAAQLLLKQVPSTEASNISRLAKEIWSEENASSDEMEQVLELVNDALSQL